MSVSPELLRATHNITYGYDVEQQVKERIAEGSLPPDTLLRLSIIGAQTRGVNGRRTKKVLLQEVLDWPESSHPRQDVTDLLTGEPPRVMLCDYRQVSRQQLDELTRCFDQPFYCKEDMVDVIARRRLIEGKTIAPEEEFLDLADTTYWSEDYVARSVAHKLWHNLLSAVNPNWLTDIGVSEFWRPAEATRYNASKLKLEERMSIKAKRAALVASAIISDELMLGLHDAKLTIGVKGVGPTGLRDMKALLAEQHPEDFPGY